MKFVSWNVNGIRACLTKGFEDRFRELDADIFCLQETKCQQGQVKIELPGDVYKRQDLDGIVSQLRLTRGVEVAIFIYETETQTFKVSLRSNGKVDVSKVAVFFGGGGHTRAAGCDLQGSMYDVVNNLTAEIEKQFGEKEE